MHHLPMSSFPDPRLSYQHPHPHSRYDPSDTTAYTYSTESQPVGGSSGGVSGGPGYAISEISCSDYASSSSRREGRQGLLIILTFIVEFLLLVLVLVIEYFIRWTEIFPIRRHNFTCDDESISCTSRDKQLMSNFAFHASVPDSAIYALSFCVPAFVVVIGEVGLYALSGGHQRNILVMNKTCSVPHIIRRLLRFLGVFVFGGLTIMAVVDVTRNMIGRLTPDFLETCQVNLSLCQRQPSLDDSACLNADTMQLRRARTSFPSLRAALTLYAASFISVYIHGAMRSHSVRVLRAFLALVFVLLSLMAGLAEYCRCESHWTDVAAGFGLGAAMSAYLTACVLNYFQDHVTQAEIQQMMRAFITDICFPFEDRSHLSRPFSDRMASLTVPRIPSMPEGPLSSAAASSALPHAQPAAAGGEPEARKQHQRRRPFTLFQRDLTQTVEYHRRHQSYMHGGTASNM